MTLSNQEWDQRILCSDGNCIGVIGADGRCKECGAPYTGDLPLPTFDSDNADDDDVVPSTEVPAAEAETHQADDATFASEPSTAEDDWEDRILCIDESCIGVVGPDGRCSECGKPYPGSGGDDIPNDH